MKMAKVDEHGLAVTEFRELEWDQIPEHKRHVWREVVDNGVPEHDPATQYVTGPDLKLTKTQAIYEYHVHSKSQKWIERELTDRKQELLLELDEINSKLDQ